MLALKQHTARVTGFTSLSGGRFASRSDDKTIKIWDPNKGQCCETIKFAHSNYDITSMTTLTDNNYFASGGYDCCVNIWQIKKGRMGGDICECILVRTIKDEQYVLSLALLDNGQLASGYRGGCVKIWNPLSGDLVRTLLCGGFDVNALLLMKNANNELACGCGKIINIWNHSTKELLTTLEGHSGTVNALAFLKNGWSLASGSDDKTIKIWDIYRGVCIRTFGDETRIRTLTLLANRYLASGGCGNLDYTIKVWEPMSGFCIKKLEGHTDYVCSTALLENGQLVSGSWDRKIIIWSKESSLKEEINEIPMYTDDTPVSEKFGARLEKSTCPICYEEIFNSREKIVLSQCGHLYCKKCFDSFMKDVCLKAKAPHCPYCTQHVSILKPEYIVFP